MYGRKECGALMINDDEDDDNNNKFWEELIVYAALIWHRPHSHGRERKRKN
jgi:hypothetical protein